MKQKNIIDKNGYFIKSVFVDDKNNILFSDYKLKEGQSLVEEQPIKDLIKPSWNGLEWTEGATEEEIKEWEEENKFIKEPSTQELLNAKLILDNAELLKANEEQKKLNAELLLKIAILGGNINV